MSQCDQLAALLSNGEWWTTRELLREVPCVVHSRIHELRDRRGLVIEHETVGPGAAGSRYRLTQIGTEPTAGSMTNDAARVVACPGGAASTASVVRADAPATVPPLAVPVAGAIQLSLEDAA